MNYYLYLHKRLDKDEIFYVGIGTKSKQDLKCGTYSRATQKHIDNAIWMAITAKTDCEYVIVCEKETREEVEKLETEYINKYGRKCDNTGTLANFTLGGEKNLGYKHTIESKKRISEAQKGKPGRRLGIKLTEEQKLNMSVIHTEVANRPDRIEFRRELAKGNTYHLGHKNSEESKKLMSKKAKERGINAISYMCRLVDNQTQEIWEANSIMDLSKLTPISLSTLSRFSQGIKVSDKISKRYTFTKIKIITNEERKQNTI